MRTFTAASSHYIELPNRGSNREFDAAASTNHVTSVRFRSSSTGSRHVVYSAGRGTGTQTNCYIDLNGSVAGQLRVVVYKSAGNLNVLTADNIADGNWHTVSLVRNGTSTWRVFLDGAQVGSDFTRATTSSTSLTRTVGRYFDTGAATAYLTGDIEFVCYHDTLTLEEHTSLHNGTNPFDVGGSCWGFVPFGPSDALHNDDIRTWFDYPLGSYFPGVVHTAGTLPALSASAIDKPWGMGPTGVNIGTANLLSMRTKDLIANGSGGDTDVEIREFGNIFARSDGYGVLYTGCNVSTNTDPQVHLATSPNLTDGGTWTKQGVVMPESTLGYYTEDPYVIEYGGSHWAFVEKRSGSSQLDIVLLESTDDGDSWVEVADPILANSTDSSFDTQDTSSPTLILLGSRLYMLYEGRSSGDNGQIGLAYSDNGPEGPWTKFNNGVNQADPVLSKTGWYANSIVPDDIFELNGDYYLLCHGQAGGSYKMGLFKTSDDQLDAGWADHVGVAITGVECNTLMFTPDPSFVLGINQTASDSTYRHLIRYELFGEETGPPTNSVAPAVTGTEANGKTLSCTTGTWTGADSYAYQWYTNGTASTSGGSAIGGATASTHVLTDSQDDLYVYCVVTATNEEGSDSEPSNVVGPILGLTVVVKANPVFADVADFQDQTLINESVGDDGAGEEMPAPSTWETDSPVGDVDWSAFTLAVDAATINRSNRAGATLISPNYVVLAAHAPGDNTGHTWMTPAGAEVTRTLGSTPDVDYWELGTGDLALAKLSAPINNITPMPMILDCSKVAGLDGLAIEMDRHLNVFTIPETLDNADEDCTISHSRASDGLESGDSGKPFVIIIDDTPVMVITAMYTASPGGPPFTGTGPNASHFIDEIFAITAEDGESPTVWDIQIGNSSSGITFSAGVPVMFSPSSPPLAISGVL